MQGKRILVIDDDPSVLGIVEYIFSEAGAEVYTATDGTEGLHQFHRCQPDLVVLDIVMPGIDGWEVGPLLRRLSDAPIIFLTALEEERNVVRGLDSGAVDYVTKPFSPWVLLARAQAALRRVTAVPARDMSPIYDDGYLTIDLERRRVLVRLEPLKLSPTEYRLLIYLFENAEQVLTHQQILGQVWGWEYRDSPNYVHVYIRHLRKKLEKDPSHPTYLLTVRGVGYRFQRQAFTPPRAGSAEITTATGSLG